MTRHRIVIEGLAPCVDNGAYPAKGIAGHPVAVEADVYREGHDELAVRLLWHPKGDEQVRAVPMRPLGNDRFTADFVPPVPGHYIFAVEAWTDVFGTWLHELEKKVGAGEPVASELLEGAQIVGAARKRAHGEARQRLSYCEARLFAVAQSPEASARRAAPGATAPEARTSGPLSVAADPELVGLMAEHGERRHHRVHAPAMEVLVERERALVGAWYELFPRSYGPRPGVHGTLRDAARRLDAVAAMGFDVVYLPPIHPIGTTSRKGKDNSLTAGPDDPGSPWAIGGPEGGHTAVDPRLGTLADFDHFVGRAQSLGLEVALDYALQCSPDHPWVREHPDWFFHRPDGSIKYAENPPKKYQDVYPLDFDSADAESLWSACRDILLFWAARGVRIFRVDNPHTKPFAFWRWCLAEVRARYPDVVFLSEAFTRPKPMYTLAKLGFSQSYTYFTWRNTKPELEAYLNELSSRPAIDCFRPNFFANTPDILPEIMQRGRHAFVHRLVLAATLSPSYGIYSGYELCENAALPGREEYAQSEKYELKWRDFSAADSLQPLVTVLNRLRREHAGLQRLEVRFLETSSDAVIAYLKADVLVVVSLSPEVVTARVKLSAEPKTVLLGAEAVVEEGELVVELPVEAPAAIYEVPA